jgi:hypothetical protein
LDTHPVAACVDEQSGPLKGEHGQGAHSKAARITITPPPAAKIEIDGMIFIFRSSFDSIALKSRR